MQICLHHAAECLAQETPREYVKQLEAASVALIRARRYGGGTRETRSELDELRRLFEMPSEPSGGRTVEDDAEEVSVDAE